MDSYNSQKLTEIALYILNATGGATILYIHKIVYCAHRNMLAKYALPLTTDTFQAWEKGPVPQSLNGALYAISSGERPRLEGMEGAISYRQTGEMQGLFVANRGYDASRLSKMERSELDIAIAECLSMTPEKLINTFHDEAWRKARGEDMRQSLTMEVSDMVRAGGVDDEDAISYAEERVIFAKGL